MIQEQDVIIRLLEALYPGVKIYLFGSRARGTNRPNSDIDIALDAHRTLTLKEVSRARKILEALNIPEKIDVVDMNSVPQELKNTILTEGIIWN